MVRDILIFSCILFAIFGLYLLLTYAVVKIVQFFEYKHCLNCPLKPEDVEDTYTCFLEDLKNRKENNVETKPKV